MTREEAINRLKEEINEYMPFAEKWNEARLDGDWTDLEEITAWMPLPKPYQPQERSE